MSLTSIDCQNMRVDSAELSDDRLLHAYLKSNDQEAFAVLVQRYGPMVWGVCRRILRDAHDAEDAFQATFAVLVRKAPSIRRKRAIGGWLHQVARRAAFRASIMSPRRAKALDATALVAPETTPDYLSSEQSAILDEEIARLPDSLRLPIVLCYLQGLTNRDAAKCLGCPEGTIVSRLARARGKLRRRLVRRGLVLSSTAAGGSLLTHSGSAATLLPELSRAALNCGRLGASSGAATGGLISAGATQLAGETLRWLSRRQLLMALVQIAGVGLAAVACFGFWMFGQRTAWDRPVGDAVTQSSGIDSSGTVTAALPGIPLDGVWQAEELEFVGGATREEHNELSRRCRWVVVDGTVRVKWDDAPLVTAQFQADGLPRPFRIDFTIDAGSLDSSTRNSPKKQTGRLPGAFDLRDSLLEVCTARTNAHRPRSVNAGIVTGEPTDEIRFRAGLTGYAKLRRLARSFEEEDLQGRWVVVKTEAGGEDLPVDARQAAGFEGTRYTLEFPNGNEVLKVSGTFKLDPAQPKESIDLIPDQGETMHCRYEVMGDGLRLCMAAPGAPRPTEFKTQPNQPHVTFAFRRSTAPPLESADGRPP